MLAVAAGWSPPSCGLNLPAVGRGTQPEGGEAGQVNRGGQQLEVLAHPYQPAHAGAPTAVAAAEQVGQLALDLGPGGAIVGQPGGVTLAGAGGGQVGLLGVDGDHPTTHAGGAGLAQRADATGSAEPGPAPTREAARIGVVTLAGQVTVWAWRSMRNWSLANRPPGAVESCVFTIGVSPWWSSQARWAPVP